MSERIGERDAGFYSEVPPQYSGEPEAGDVQRAPNCATGERCTLCGEPAAVKLGQEWPESDGHNATAYVCQEHANRILFPYMFRGVTPKEERPEPVAWMVEEQEQPRWYTSRETDLLFYRQQAGTRITPLYTAPAFTTQPSNPSSNPNRKRAKGK